MCIQPELYLVASLNSILCPAAGSSPCPCMQSMAALLSLSPAWAPWTTDLPRSAPCILEEQLILTFPTRTTPRPVPTAAALPLLAVNKWLWMYNTAHTTHHFKASCVVCFTVLYEQGKKKKKQELKSWNTLKTDSFAFLLFSEIWISNIWINGCVCCSRWSDTWQGFSFNGFILGMSINDGVYEGQHHWTWSHKRLTFMTLS